MDWIGLPLPLSYRPALICLMTHQGMYVIYTKLRMLLSAYASETVGTRRCVQVQSLSTSWYARPTQQQYCMSETTRQSTTVVEPINVLITRPSTKQAHLHCPPPQYPPSSSSSPTVAHYSASSSHQKPCLSSLSMTASLLFGPASLLTWPILKTAVYILVS